MLLAKPHHKTVNELRLSSKSKKKKIGCMIILKQANNKHMRFCLTFSPPYLLTILNSDLNALDKLNQNVPMYNELNLKGKTQMLY